MAQGELGLAQNGLCQLHSHPSQSSSLLFSLLPTSSWCHHVPTTLVWIPATDFSRMPCSDSLTHSKTSPAPQLFPVFLFLAAGTPCFFPLQSIFFSLKLSVSSAPAILAPEHTVEVSPSSLAPDKKQKGCLQQGLWNLNFFLPVRSAMPLAVCASHCVTIPSGVEEGEVA